MTKIKCTHCGEESEAELTMLEEQELLEVTWVCDCHEDTEDLKGIK